MNNWKGLLTLATIAICVALVAIADAMRERARADQMTAQACAVCTEMNTDCSAVCGAQSNDEDDRWTTNQLKLARVARLTGSRQVTLSGRMALLRQ